MIDNQPDIPTDKTPFPLTFIPVFWIRLAVVGLAIFVFALTYFARVSYAGSDARFSLLVSQTIWQEGTIQLDGYPELDESMLQLNEHNDRLYYYFPIGTPLFSTPFVWLANQLGQDMLRGADDAALQNLLSALSCVVIYLLLYQISRTYLPPAWSLVVATTTMLGSSLVSTLGTALWNLNLSTLFVLLAILLWLHCQRPNASRYMQIALGFTLFAAFICRPTTAPFIALLLGYLLFYDRAKFWIVASTSAVLLGGWLAFNLYEFGQLLSPYYGVSRLQTTAQDGTLAAIYGQLFSPSRGIFVFSPFLLLGVGVMIWRWPTFRHNRLVLWCVGWFVLHVVVVSLGDSVPWWGGHSYGSRFMTDVLPALFLLSLIVLQAVYQGRFSLGFGRGVVLAYLVFGGFAVFVNGVQGLYNGNTARWNGTNLEPDPGFHRQYLFDWRYPQFLALKQNLCERHQEFMKAEFGSPSAVLPFNEEILVGTSPSEALFVGFSKNPLADGRYNSECADLFVEFQTAEVGDRPIMLTARLTAQTPQTINVWLNDVPLESIDIEQPITDLSAISILVPAKLLSVDGVNQVHFYQPAADSLLGDPYVQGIQLYSISLDIVTDE